MIVNTEEKRLEALNDYHILDTAPEEDYDNIVKLAAFICDCTIAVITLIDKDRQWFKAKVGIDGHETQRCFAFCNYTIQQDDLLEVIDAREDSRFKDNPYVTGNPHIKFYTGAPLVNKDGYRLGSLCVIDKEPKYLNENQKNSLIILSKQVVNNFELRKSNYFLEETVRIKTADLIITNNRLFETKELFKSLADNSIDTIIRLDEDLNVLYINRDFRNNSAFRQELWIGQKINASSTRFQLAEIVIELSVSAKEKKDTISLFHHIDFNNTTHYYYLTCIPEKDTFNEIHTLLILIRDITDLKNNEIQLLQANKELDRFVYSASHELRAPVKNLLGISQLFEMDFRENDQSGFSEYISGIKLCAERLDSTVDNIISYSKNNRKEIIIDEIDFSLIIKKILTNLSDKIQEEQIKISQNVQMSEKFYSDKDRIETVLYHLILNAITYRDTAKQFPLANIEIKSNSEKCNIIVTDNGIGIKEQYLERIFEMFFRASTTGIGVGLGLYITREIVSRLGGKISVLSELQKGTTFEIIFPNQFLKV